MKPFKNQYLDNITMLIFLIGMTQTPSVDGEKIFLINILS